MPATDDSNRRAKANVWRLSAAVALAGAHGAAIFATGGIVGAELAPDPALATLPLSFFVVGMAAGTLPSGAIARAWGRRPVFIIGTGIGCLSSLIAALAIVRGSFALFCFAAFLGGLYGAVAQTFRFAAAEGASDSFRPRAVAWVMAGGVLSGILGPQLVTWTMDVWAPYLFAASFLAQAVVALIAMAVLSQVDLDKPRAEDHAGARPLAAIVRQPAFISAAICGVVSYALMNFVMTSAPLAMKICGFGPADSNLVLQEHIVAMYLPSFFTGALIARFGAPAIVATGLGAIAAAAVTGLAGIGFGHFSLGLVLLGAGWNFGFIGASAMVLGTHRSSERTKVQAFNDFLVFGVMAIGSFSSGELLALYGWASVNWVVFPPVVLALAMLALAARARRAPQPALP